MQRPPLLGGGIVAGGLLGAPPEEGGACSSSQPLLPRTPRSSSPDEEARVRQLPDLMHRIKDLGLVEEYSAFKTSYCAWRQGKARGAKGEVTHDHISRPEHLAANRAFSYRTPTVQEWLWRRTISYWVVVTFFEGAIFFALSSFMMNYPERLGSIYTPLTTYGYLAGKACFFIGCYFMCLEVINIEVDNDESPAGTQFIFNPFRYGVALGKLTKAGHAPWPYAIAFNYFVGVLFFVVGFLTLIFPIPEFIGHPIKVWTFVLGSVLFMVGGMFECVENQVTQIFSGTWTLACASASCNFIGGCFFTLGSIQAFYDAFAGNISYGIGSMLYMLAASIQLYMWKDEQFGLTFLSILNSLDHPGEVNILAGSPNEQERRNTFSWGGVVCVHLYCWCGAMSTYNVNVMLARFIQTGEDRHFHHAFNEFLPCVVSHLMLALNSAVIHMPKVSPFRQLFVLSRALVVLLAINSTWTFYLFLVSDYQG